MVSRIPKRRTGNRLLDALPTDELESLRQLWQAVSCPAGEELCHEGHSLAYVHFPISGIYSTLVALRDGSMLEAATVGNEGLVGISAVLGLDFSAKTATAPVSGECLRLSVAELRSQLARHRGLDRILHRYAAFALRNAYQTVVCNAAHSTVERLCRWLLASQDRLAGDFVAVTHEALAHLLGVRRQTVTVILGTLQVEGLIHLRRGGVHILDRSGLESWCCECYGVSRSLYDKIVLGTTRSAN